MNDTQFDFATLRALYDSKAATPRDVVRLAFDRIAGDDRPDVWISLADREAVERKAEALMSADRSKLPLWGIPFSVKDNIDTAGLPTTAACPAFEYRPQKSARVVARLEAAGAICLGKTNLDQFATGLNGTRSPYGACGSAFSRSFVSGGSSSGSAVSVALHHVSFSIGTDTGGSGRIPAGLNNVIGLKPTLGTLSNQGLVPNCRTLDCPSVFALTVSDAREVADAALVADLTDPTLRDDVERAVPRNAEIPADLKILVPQDDQIEVFGNTEAKTLFDTAISKIAKLVPETGTLDLDPFLEAGSLVFDGPWICDRHSSIGGFVEANTGAVLPETLAVLANAAKWSGSATFESMARLRELRAYARTRLRSNCVLVVPTVAPLYTIEQMQADPITRNTHHGYYSYFVNPLDLCAMAIPAGFYAHGMPFGITLVAPAFADRPLAAFASRIIDSLNIRTGKPRSC